jgi:hypothetical protein
MTRAPTLAAVYAAERRIENARLDTRLHLVLARKALNKQFFKPYVLVAVAATTGLIAGSFILRGIEIGSGWSSACTMDTIDHYLDGSCNFKMIDPYADLVRSLVNTRNLSSSETLNSITVRDTADKVRIIQRILETLDKSRAEVVIDIELIEVDSARMRELGVSLSSYSVTQTLDLGKDAPVRISDLQNLT